MTSGALYEAWGLTLDARTTRDAAKQGHDEAGEAYYEAAQAYYEAAEEYYEADLACEKAELAYLALALTQNAGDPQHDPLQHRLRMGVEERSDDKR